MEKYAFTNINILKYILTNIRTIKYIKYTINNMHIIKYSHDSPGMESIRTVQQHMISKSIESTHKTKHHIIQQAFNVLKK